MANQSRNIAIAARRVRVIGYPSGWSGVLARRPTIPERMTSIRGSAAVPTTPGEMIIPVTSSS